MPKASCEHLEEHVKVRSLLEQVKPDNVCGECGHEEENWICLACGDCFCGRFINRHMVDHSMEKYHLVALSLSDLSFWCYVCDEYIIHTNPILHPLYRDAHKGKFGDYPPGTNESDQ
ncbi:Oidioi.mRNA.OKI2018_I69.XSR.g13520.t1.cds [Oikopleura dioica]|uniref:Oidioi.mRNA.OKI2018_I69.XSR.g13520.t1.cds n=1 Tax=Oikopleura dioica TaxID=34765 RepID=A0ABN7S742_OIKDI|nr:Oidioi.mRNA.OKI2018_I69.XSR.g13520.t1.cds [Oikopleura dioica]